MSGRIRGKLAKKVRRRSLADGLVSQTDGRRQSSEPTIGYDGTNFTRNGEKTTRDSLRMG